MTDILVMEAVNLFIGDHDPEASKHLKLQSFAMPVLEYVTVDHLGGGAAGELEIPLNTLRKIEPGFKLAGFDEDAYRLFGIGSNEINVFTGYGVIANQRTAKRTPAKVVYRGMISRMAPDAFDRSNVMGHDHKLAKVTRYDLEVGGKAWWEWDYWTTKRVRFGVDELADYRRMLGLQ